MCGAHVRVRTGDLVLTKDVLCQLSYVGPRRCVTRGLRASAVSQDEPILDKHRSIWSNLCRRSRIEAQSSDGKRWWAGRESNPHSRRRLIYSQRSSPPAQPTHGPMPAHGASSTVADGIRPMQLPQPSELPREAALAESGRRADGHEPSASLATRCVERSLSRRNSLSRPTNGGSSVSARLRPPTSATTRTASQAGKGAALPLRTCSPAGWRRWLAMPAKVAWSTRTEPGAAMP